jgi:hypothetical protein
MRHLAELDCIERWNERDEVRGGGGLRWGSESWKDVLAMYAGDPKEGKEEAEEADDEEQGGREPSEEL